MTNIPVKGKGPPFSEFYIAQFLVSCSSEEMRTDTYFKYDWPALDYLHDDRWIGDCIAAKNEVFVEKLFKNEYRDYYLELKKYIEESLEE